MQPSQTEQPRRAEYSILFGDVRGFSRLNRFQQGQFMAKVLPLFAKAFEDEGQQPDSANTWGDGIVAFFRGPTVAVRTALRIRDAFRAQDWDSCGLPKLEIRLALHAGEVLIGYDPVRKTEGIIGTDINLAARIEPIVEPNNVYTTAAFRARCQIPTVTFKSLGEVSLAKDWGKEPLFVAVWDNEPVEGRKLQTIDSNVYSFFQELRSLLIYFANSKFGQRLTVSQEAKRNIARHLVTSGFWTANEAVFLESGTLPVYMVYELFSQNRPDSIPKMIVTNNIAAATIAMMGKRTGFDQSQTTISFEVPTNIVVMDGIIMEDYAATIPEALLRGLDSSLRVSKQVIASWKTRGLFHMIMMATRLSAEVGPCALSPPMRRFKRSMLRYVLDNPGVRLSVVVEAEKLVGRQGEPAGSRYWKDLLARKQVYVISACSPEMRPDDIRLAKRELNSMTRQGASVLLLDEKGCEVAVA